MSDQQSEQPDNFFERITVPVNYEASTNGFDFVNPVEVAEMFAAATGIAAELGGQAERITSQIANVEYQLAQKEREMAKLRRLLIADNFGAVKSGWSNTVLEAFILDAAMRGGKYEHYIALENEIDAHQDNLGLLKPRHEKLKHRSRVLERNMDMAKQYLDFDKLMQRVTTHGRGV